ncbi:hypothetical protein J2X09_003630 [Hydrogenophaga laconesensis]|uniref:Uncharacterized protein n=1 Tax=Hydrogenophaga laconesensis TaxID=1805971 RepID=A0ABU1VEJ3_9BURK|nr:hypothetical protein [Hydrogenophaga laconesensis]
MQQLQDELLESRMRMFSAGNFKASPVERGPQPESFFI